MDDSEVTTASWTNQSHDAPIQNISYDMQSITDTKTFQYYAWGVVGSVISVFGLLGNILSIVVLSNRRMRSSTSCYLISQAVYDSLVIIALLLFMSLPAIFFQTHPPALVPYYKFFPYLQPVGYPLALTVQMCSIYTTVGFTVERYIAVCYPLKAAKMCTISRARKSNAVILLCCIMYNIPRWLEYQTVTYFNPHTNITEVDYNRTAIGANRTFQHIYFIYMHLFFMLVIPFMVVMVLNLFLARAVRRSATAQGKVSHKQRRENNLTVMLISVVAVFLICQVPSIFDNIFSVTLDTKTTNTRPFIVLTCLSSLMVVTNSAANFYLYCVFGKKFRQVFCWMFFSCLPYRTKDLTGYACEASMTTKTHAYTRARLNEAQRDNKQPQDSNMNGSTWGSSNNLTAKTGNDASSRSPLGKKHGGMTMGTDV